MTLGARLPRGELAGAALPRLDRLLGYVGRTVHLVGQDHPMPVDAGRFGQMVGDLDARFVALGHADAWSRHLLVEGVVFDPFTRQYV